MQRFAFTAEVDGKPIAAEWDDTEGCVRILPEQAGKGSVLMLTFTDLSARQGEAGFFLMPDGTNTYLVRFGARENTVYTAKRPLLACFGVKTPRQTVLLVAEGMGYAMSPAVTVQDGVYTPSFRYDLEGELPYEPLTVRILSLPPAAGESEMAAAYRTFRKKAGMWIPLAERAKREAVAYAVEAPEIRIRMGWKPAPPTVLEQTPENEPEMHVACTFADVERFLTALHTAGVDKAEICLVGWNVRGHDGRWPQIFPVEEALGGEKELSRLLAHARRLGYRMVCHTNSTDAYSIADCFSKDLLVQTADGTVSVDENGWSGGRMYHVCPVKSLELAERMLPQVAELGFSGLHYIDVMTVNPLRSCHAPAHPVTLRETAELYRRIGMLCRSLFGGFASEGVYEFASDVLDYGFYTSWDFSHAPLCDENIPFWAMVYHGSVLANPSTHTVNYPIKRPEDRLYFWECGGRPSFYLYSKFMQGGALDNWLGAEDLGISDAVQTEKTVQAIAQAYREYRPYADLQYSPIKRREVLDGECVRVTYEDGSTVTVDYANNRLSVWRPEEKCRMQ